MRHLLTLAAVVGIIILTGCNPNSSQTNPETTSKIALDYLQDAEFESVIKEKTPVVVMFNAAWCGHCKPLKQDLEKMANEFAGRAKFCVIDNNQSIIDEEHNVGDVMPTTIILKDGKVLGRVEGNNANQIREKLHTAL